MGQAKMMTDDVLTDSQFGLAFLSRDSHLIRKGRKFNHMTSDQDLPPNYFTTGISGTCRCMRRLTGYPVLGLVNIFVLSRVEGRSTTSRLQLTLGCLWGNKSIQNEEVHSLPSCSPRIQH
jgi:hypothetical protein